MVYDSLNFPVLTLVPQDCKNILDLGCGAGSLGRAMRDSGARRVTGVTSSEEEAESAANKLDHVVVADLNSIDMSLLGGPFDCVVCSHSLEHLYRPDELLVRVQRVLTSRAAAVVALPNVLFWRSRLMMLAGNFQYTDGGIMDRTHYRFYDWRSAHALLADTGYHVDASFADGGFPLARYMPGLGPLLSRAVLKHWPGLFGWQFVLRGWIGKL